MSSLFSPPRTGGKVSSEIEARWLPRLNSRSGARLRLFCFPYAGGDALSIFRKWSQEVPASVEICPVQIPGRGVRVSEPRFTSLVSVVGAIAGVLQSHMDKPFALFGHSMGAMISFELARLLRKEFAVEPRVLFVSGRAAAQIPDNDPLTCNLPDSEFLEELKRINGTPKEVLEHPELLELMLPILKADFQICQTHTYVDDPPLTCPITVFGGLRDEPTRMDLDAWRKQTRGPFSLHMLPGDHFFIRTEQSNILGIISSQLSKIISTL